MEPEFNLYKVYNPEIEMWSEDQDSSTDIISETNDFLENFDVKDCSPENRVKLELLIGKLDHLVFGNNCEAILDKAININDVESAKRCVNYIANNKLDHAFLFEKNLSLILNESFIVDGKEELNHNNFPIYLKLAVDSKRDDRVWECLVHMNRLNLNTINFPIGQPYEDFVSIFKQFRKNYDADFIPNNVLLITQAYAPAPSIEFWNAVEKLSSYLPFRIECIYEYPTVPVSQGFLSNMADLTVKLAAKRALREAALVKSSFFNWGCTKNENSTLRILPEEVLRLIAMAHYQVCDNGAMDRIITPEYYQTITNNFYDKSAQ